MSGRLANSVFVFSAVCALAFLLPASGVRAATSLYFDAGGAPAVWDNTTANWATTSNGLYNHLWADGADAMFQGTAGTVNVSGTISSVNSLTFGVDGYTLSGGTVTLTGLYAKITTGSGCDTISSVLAGTGGITKRGSGSLVLGGDNTYSGITMIDGGTLVLSSVKALQRSVLFYDNYGGTVSFGALTSASICAISGHQDLALANEASAPVALTVSCSTSGGTYYGVLSGPGSLIIDAGGGYSQELRGRNTYSGGTVLSRGTLSFATDSLGGGLVTFQGGTLGWCSGNTQDISGQMAPIAAGQLALIDPNSQSITFAHPLSGAGGLDVIDVGTLTLSAANNYSGPTRQHYGNIILANTNALQNSTLVLDDSSTSPGTVKFGAISSANLGGLSGGQFGGSLSLTNDSAGPVALTVGSDNESTQYTGKLTGNGSLTKVGTGTLAFSLRANTYTGGTTINAGTLQVATYQGLPGYNVAGSVVVNNGGTLAVEVGGNSGGVPRWGTNIGILLNNASFNPGSTLGIDTTNASNGNFSYSSPITGTLAIAKLGTGTLTLTGANAYSGGTAIQAGTLAASSLGALPGWSTPGNVVVNSGGTLALGTGGPGQWAVADIGTALTTVVFQPGSTLGIDTTNASGGNVTYGSSLSGSIGLAKLGTGTLTLTGASAYSGGTTIQAGTLAASSLGALPGWSTPGNVVVNSGGTLAVNVGGPNEWATADIGTILSNVTFASGAALGMDTTNASGGNFVFGNVLSGSIGLAKLGTGTLTLTGANAYSGGTTVNQGALQLGDGSTLNGSVVGNITDSATLIFANPSDQTWPGVISGTGSITKIGAGTLTATGASAYGGSTTVNAGTLKLSGGNNRLPVGTTLTLANVSGAALDLNSQNQTIASLSGGGASGGNVSLGAGALTVGSGTYAGALRGAGGKLIKQGGGTLILSGTNTYDGGTTINGGMLQAQNTAALPDWSIPGGVVVNNGGILAVNAGGENEWAAPDIGTLLANATFNSGSALGMDTTNASGGTFTYSDPIGGNLSLTKLGDGTLILAGANVCSGATTVNGGAILLGDGNALQNSTVNFVGGTMRFGALTGATIGGLAGSQNLQLTNDGPSPVTLTVGNNNQSATYSGSLSGTGSLIKVGTGTQSLTAVNTYTGGTTVNGGMLQAKSTAALPGYGTPGSVVVNGGGTLAINVGGAGEWATEDIDALLGNVAFQPGSALGVDTTNAPGGPFSGSFTYAGDIGGCLGLTKLGAGTLTLSGQMTYTGPTTVVGGTLVIDDTVIGSVPIPPPIVIFPGPITIITCRPGSWFGGIGSVIGGGTYPSNNTTAQILAGAAGSSGASVSMSWRTATTAEKTLTGGGLLSDVVNLSGVAPAGGDPGSVFVLQMSYDPTALSNLLGLTEGQAATQGGLLLGYYDAGSSHWLDATAQNLGNDATGNERGYLGTFTAFQTAFGTTLSSYIGAYGVDTATHTVWAVLDHNSQFAVVGTAVPEPGTLALLAIGVLGLLGCAWRRWR